MADAYSISAAEERFERVRRTAGFVVGPGLFVVLWLFPWSGLTSEAQRLAAIMGLVLVFWLTEPIPIAVTALLGPVLCILLGVAPAKVVLPNFGHPLILLFLGGFILAQAMQVHGVSRRLALTMLARPWVAASPYRVMFALGAVTTGLSMWVSNTATAAMMFPIGLGVLGAMAGRARPSPTAGGAKDPVLATPFGMGMMLLIAYSASIGGLATPVGSPPNLIGLAALDKLTGTKLSFFQWMAFALPVTVVLYLVLFFYLAKVCPPRGLRWDGAGYAAAELGRSGPWSRGQVNTVVAFGVTVGLWLVPGGVALGWGMGSPPQAWCERHLPESAAALVGAILLFFLPVRWAEREFTLTVKEAFAIDWGTLLLFGGGLALGEQMFATGLAKELGTALAGAVGVHSPLALTAFAVALAIVMTETTSNTAAANMVVPVAIAIAQGAGVDPVAPALGAAMGCSMGFLLPVSTPPNAIVYSSGLVPITRMVRYGLAMSVAALLVVTGAARWWLPWMGF